MKSEQLILSFTLAILLWCSCTNEDYYVKSLRFPEGISAEEKVEMAARLVPTVKQLQWQQMEMTAFLHFGMNTFTGNEWGNGTDSPELFNPSSLDCRQWAKTLKEGAKAPYADEGRGKLRKATRSRKQALIRRYPNGETRRE